MENLIAYVTVEPCLMCGYALILAKIPKVIYIVNNEKFGGIKSLFNLPLNCIQIDLYNQKIIDLLKKFYNMGNQKLDPKKRHRYKKGLVEQIENCGKDFKTENKEKT